MLNVDKLVELMDEQFASNAWLGRRTGKSRWSIKAYKSGARKPDFVTVSKMAIAFGVDVSILWNSKASNKKAA